MIRERNCLSRESRVNEFMSWAGGEELRAVNKLIIVGLVCQGPGEKVFEHHWISVPTTVTQLT
jgi:hypothetical protein